MEARRRSRLSTKCVITPRRRRELEQAFAAEMRAVRLRSKQPHPREALDVLVDRLFEQFEAILSRYEQLFGVWRKPSRRGRRGNLRAELADLDRPRVVPLSVGHVKAMLQTKADEWRGLLRKHAPIARQMVRKLVEGRIVFTPDREGRRYTFLATGTLANFFSGIVCPQAVASPTGVVQEWTRPVPGEVPAGSGSGKAA